MGFTIPERDYTSLRECTGTSGVHVVTQIGEKLQRETRRTWEIAFDASAQTITILDSEELKPAILRDIMQNYQNHPWTPKLLHSKPDTDKVIRLLCGTGSTRGSTDLKRRRDDGPTSETPEAKAVRVVTEQLSNLPITR